jgi:4-amino-4-deoxy-L-arabinose transferase-like glycosyltransferase
MKFLARNWDVLLFGLIAGSFVYVASVRLEEVPVPQTDESYTLQVPYEMLNHGKLALPILRYLGGNIENVWHSYTPVFFVILSGFFKVFGWGLLEGRAFNLITAVLTLLMVYLIGRRLFDWRAGLIAVVMLVSDPTFLERSRLVRNDFAAAALALLAFYLYSIARERKSNRLFVCSGLTAGAGVMCHTNILYMLVAIGILMLIQHGWRVIKTKEAFFFYGSALVVMSYEIIYILIDWNNFLLQNRDDRLHFYVLSLDGIGRNFVKERIRYLDWIEGGNRIANLPLTLLHIFQVLAAVAVVYLIVRIVRAIKRREAHQEPRVPVMVGTLVVALFMAIVSGNKAIYYLAHLTPWFALCVGIMLSDLISLIGLVRESEWRRSKPVHAGLLVLLGITTVVYGRALYRQQTAYLKEVRREDRVLFNEFKSVLRDVVPDELCPVAMKSPVMWLVFPEADRCFASIEDRMEDNVDIEGNEYALILPNAGTQMRNEWKERLDEKYPVIGKLQNTVYGNIDVYYTGKNPTYGLATPKTYYFFDKSRGHFSDEQLSAAARVWSVNEAANSTGSDAGGMTFVSDPTARGIVLLEVATLNLEADTIYQISVTAVSNDSSWQLVVVDLRSGVWVLQRDISGGPRSEAIDAIFRTTGTDRIKIALRPLDHEKRVSIKLLGAALNRVAPLWKPKTNLSKDMREPEKLAAWSCDQPVSILHR